MDVPYTYKAEVLRVIDGDTVVIRVDVGFRMFAEMPMRLAFINAPEMNTDAGKESKAALLDQLNEVNFQVVVQTYKPIDKYGRYLGTIYAGDFNLNTWMLENHWAQEYKE